MLQRSNDPACRAGREIRKIPKGPLALTGGGRGPRSGPAYAVLTHSRRRGGRVAEGGSLLNCYTGKPVSWVRIPSPPPLRLGLPNGSPRRNAVGDAVNELLVGPRGAKGAQRQRSPSCREEESAPSARIFNPIPSATMPRSPKRWRGHCVFGGGGERGRARFGRCCGPSAKR
jgi:hypothetical protein